MTALMTAIRATSFEGLIFFVYDREAVKKESDPPENAIVYFYPPSVSIEDRISICGQMIGMSYFIHSFIGSTPALCKLQTEKMATVQSGKFTLALGGSLSEPDSLLIKQLETLLHLFTFYHGSLDRIRSMCENQKQFLTWMNVIWDCYLHFVRHYGDFLPGVFDPLPFHELPKSVAATCFTKASYILQACQRRQHILGGCILYSDRILCSQLEPSITERLLLLKPNQRNHPARPVKTGHDLPFGVRILNAFLTLSEYPNLLEALTESAYRQPGSSESPRAFPDMYMTSSPFVIKEHFSREGTGDNKQQVSSGDSENSSNQKDKSSFNSTENEVSTDPRHFPNSFGDQANREGQTTDASNRNSDAVKKGLRFKIAENPHMDFDRNSVESNLSNDVGLIMEPIDVSDLKVVTCRESRLATGKEDVISVSRSFMNGNEIDGNDVKRHSSSVSTCREPDSDGSKVRKLPENEAMTFCRLLIDDIITQVCEMIEDKNSSFAAARSRTCVELGSSPDVFCVEALKSQNICCQYTNVCESRQKGNKTENFKTYSKTSPVYSEQGLESGSTGCTSVSVDEDKTSCGCQETGPAVSIENIDSMDACSNKGHSSSEESTKIPMDFDSVLGFNVNVRPSEKVSEKCLAGTGAKISQNEASDFVSEYLNRTKEECRDSARNDAEILPSNAIVCSHIGAELGLPVLESNDQGTEASSRGSCVNASCHAGDDGGKPVTVSPVSSNEDSEGGKPVSPSTVSSGTESDDWQAVTVSPVSSGTESEGGVPVTASLVSSNTDIEGGVLATASSVSSSAESEGVNSETVPSVSSCADSESDVPVTQSTNASKEGSDGRNFVAEASVSGHCSSDIYVTNGLKEESSGAGIGGPVYAARDETRERNEEGEGTSLTDQDFEEQQILFEEEGDHVNHVEGLTHVNLYVQAHSKVVLILLAEEGLSTDCNSIKALWETSLNQLGELEFLVKQSSGEEPTTMYSEDYSFLVYDSFERTMKGNLSELVHQVDHLFCETTKVLHEQFENSSTLKDIMLRDRSSTVYGKSNLGRGTYFHLKGPHRTMHGVPSHRDPFLKLEKRATKVLNKDHGVNIF
ncbi:uncharacterized protein LOC141895328 isoform X1 [Acropora palmata]|uniref:uncharacterized protein LOC141895328 isoform X1 n=2 Tax=Acropora palmata TaxID=6131 RepID=UPI003DA11D9C